MVVCLTWVQRVASLRLAGGTVLSLSKTPYPLLSTGSTQEDNKTSQLDWKIADWDLKHQHKQTFKDQNFISIQFSPIKARIFLLVDLQEFDSDLGSGWRKKKKSSENDQLTGHLQSFFLISSEKSSKTSKENLNL